MNGLNAAELPVLYGIQEAIGCPALDTFFSLLTHLGDAGIFWILLAGVLLCFRKTRKAGLTMAVSLVLGLLVCNLGLKPLAARLRPYTVDPSIQLLIPPEHDFSFPSGHTTASFEGAVSLLFFHKKSGVAALVLALLIAFSRLYLCVHYPTDVLAGAILGSLLAWAAHAIVGRLYVMRDTSRQKQA